MSGNLNMSHNKILNLSPPRSESDAANKKYIDVKTSSINQDGDIDLKEKYNIINLKQLSFQHLSANYDNLVSFNDVQDIFLLRKESFPMETSLDMNGHFIYDVKKPEKDDQGVNKKIC